LLLLLLLLLLLYKKLLLIKTCCGEIERDTGDVFLQPRKRRDILHIVCGERGTLVGLKIARRWVSAGYHQA